MKINPTTLHKKGFALIVTLSLMILLTVIAVGLLTLSTISLRSSGQANAQAAAQANARLALMMAIGELQKTAGPDQRITAPADLVNSNAPTGVTGVWKSAKESYTNPDYVGTKTGDNFLGYQMSNPTPATAADPKSLPTGTQTLELVGKKSVGTKSTSHLISAPLVPVSGSKSKNASGGIAWVTLDEGTKARIDLLPLDTPSGVGESVTQAGAAARNGFETVEKMAFLKADRSELLGNMPKLVSLDAANLKADAKDATTRYFHDFTVSSSTLQTDVANGGLKTDLSVLFDGASGATVPANYANRYLYSDTATPFQGTATSSDVQWSYLANFMRLYRRTTANDNPKVGMKAALPTGYSLKTIQDLTLKKPRYEPNMAALKAPLLMPTVLRVDTVFSLVSHDAHAGRANASYPYMLHLMYLPVITLHNPYNVPLRVTNIEVEFSDIPVGFEFLVNGQASTTGGLMPLNQLYTGTPGGAQKTFKMNLSTNLSAPGEVVMGAGETRIFGTPFPASGTWAEEVSKNGSGKAFFDWQSNQTTSYTMPGMITSQIDAVGFDVDWLAPNNRAAWLKTRRDDGVIMLKADDDIKVRYGPVIPATAASNNSFSIIVRLNGINAGNSQVFYSNAARLKKIMEEGVSERFPDPRSFPESCPRASETPINTMSLYEANTTKIKDYAKARPFAIFSVGLKTTMEAFTRSRPVADTGIAYQMATCDFTTAETQGSSPLEFALVPVKKGGFVIESGGIQDSTKTAMQGFFFGGNGSNRGTNNATFYEIPMAPLQSIAQLRHANTGSIGAIPYVTYTVGESRAHPAVPSGVAFYKPDSSRVVLDRTWLANDQLWDKYWFSTLSTLQGMAYTGSAAVTQEQLARDFFAGTRSLPNPRNAPHIPVGKTANDSAAAARTATGLLSAAHILTRGGFNVNSTSVDAWVSVLSGMVSGDVPLVSGSTDKNPPGTPMLRTRQPVLGTGGSAGIREKLWNSYRTMDDAEVRKLAEQIVVEVKARGPFLSMAEFVNRRLGPSGDLTSKGAIQAAIDSIKLNSPMEGNARLVNPTDVGSYGWQNAAAVTTNTGAGAPGEISQGDVLSSIGSFATVRSDTFRIRASGDARDAKGSVIARAWCEATIQRIPEYVDRSETSEISPPALPANLNFGRQFKIVSFRWLHADEI